MNSYNLKQKKKKILLLALSDLEKPAYPVMTEFRVIVRCKASILKEGITIKLHLGKDNLFYL